MVKLQKMGTLMELPVIELVNSSNGNHKKLSDGTIVPLTEKEWREELAKSFKPLPALEEVMEEIVDRAGWVAGKPGLQKIGSPKPRLQKIWREKKQLQKIN